MYYFVCERCKRIERTKDGHFFSAQKNLFPELGNKPLCRNCVSEVSDTMYTDKDDSLLTLKEYKELGPKKQKNMAFIDLGNPKFAEKEFNISVVILGKYHPDHRPSYFAKKFVFEHHNDKSGKTYTKRTTIRGNYNRWKEALTKDNAALSVREWESVPYRSKQRILGLVLNPIVQKLIIKKIEGVVPEFYFHGNKLSQKDLELLAYNDGLSFEEFKLWFDVDVPCKETKTYSYAIIHFGDIIKEEFKAYKYEKELTYETCIFKETSRNRTVQQA